LAWLKLSAKRADKDASRESWEFDDIKVVSIFVEGVNDRPVANAVGLERYASESSGILTDDKLGRGVESVRGVEVDEDGSVGIVWRVRDVDSSVLSCDILGTYGTVVIADLDHNEKVLVTGGGNGSERVGIRGAVQDLNDALESLSFNPLPNWWSTGKEAAGGASCSIICVDGLGSVSVRSTVGVKVLPVDDAVSLRMPDDGYGNGRVVLVDEDEGVSLSLGGAWLSEREGEILGITSTTTTTENGNGSGNDVGSGFELFRSEGEVGWRDRTVGEIGNRSSVDDVAWRGTMVKDINGGSGGLAGSDPAFFAQLGELLYFTATSSNSEGGEDRELWRTDGSPAGTVVVTVAESDSDSDSESESSMLTDPAWTTAFNGFLYFSARGVDLSWAMMAAPEHSDSCGGFRADSMAQGVFYAVAGANVNVWEVGREYDCPVGYHWASTAEGEDLFRSDVDWKGAVGEERVYVEMCGWEGFTYGGVERRKFRFSGESRERSEAERSEL